MNLSDVRPTKRRDAEEEEEEERPLAVWEFEKLSRTVADGGAAHFLSTDTPPPLVVGGDGREFKGRCGRERHRYFY